MATSFENMFFGPLDKNACIIFRLFSGFFFFVLIFAIFSELYWLSQNYRNLNMRFATSGLLLVFNAFVAYFVNRLLYTMCSKLL